MKKRLKLLLAAVLCILCAAAVGCGGDSQSQRELKVYNWGDYIDPEVLRDFEKETGIKIVYDAFATNEDMYVKIKSGGSDYDVAIPSDYMIKRMIDEDLVEKIDMTKLDQYGNIDDHFKNLAYDPQNEYSVPYMWGTVGIVYNKTMVSEPVDSWSILWNPKYEKQILMLDSPRDSLGITLKYLGYSLNTKDDAQIDEARRKLIEQKPLVLAYVVDEVKDKMIAGEAALAVVWSGDAMYIKGENPDIEYAVPKEGSNLWFDAAVIIKGTKHKVEAEEFINYLLRPEVSQRNAAYIGYSTPIAAARDMLDAAIKNDPTAYPSDEVIAQQEVFDDLTAVIGKYNNAWTEIKAAR